jgi:hypothetical protein
VLLKKPSLAEGQRTVFVFTQPGCTLKRQLVKTGTKAALTPVNSCGGKFRQEYGGK